MCIAPGIDGLAFSEKSFDVALCIQVPDLVENEKAFFLKVFSLFKREGRLVVTLTNRFSYKHLMRKILLRNNRKNKEVASYVQNRVYRFSVSEIIRRAQNAGFAVRSMKGYNWIPFPKASNSKLIPFAANIEHTLMLHKIALFSPWVIICFSKNIL